MALSSSSIADIRYDAKARLLIVHFVKGGYFEYHEVPEAVYRDFMEAPSKGKFFNMNIRNSYA